MIAFAMTLKLCCQSSPTITSASVIPGGFHLINAAAERRWMTPSGKANFITSKGLLEDPSSAFNSKLVMATVRSHDQYNTTIYGMDDRYRGYSVNEMWSL